MPIFSHGDVKAKLLILYFVRGAKIDVSAEQIYACLFALDYTDYFTFCGAIAELKEDGFLAEVPRAFGQSCKLTLSGKEALELFEESIPQSERESIRRYIAEHSVRMQQETQLSSSMEPLDEGGYMVCLVASEQNRTILEIKMQVASRETAMIMRKNWAEESCFIYDTLYSHLLKER
ncbi:MAG: DUF4364 family protein [Clostridia bacterium]|nr:DUF4364 family protein [Clostridia bacterium]